MANTIGFKLIPRIYEILRAELPSTIAEKIIFAYADANSREFVPNINKYFLSEHLQ